VDTILKLLFGVTCILLGAKVIRNPVFYNKQWGQLIDVSGFNIPLGCAFILFGIIFIYLELSSKKRKRH
jgi:predicted phage tail protein